MDIETRIETWPLASPFRITGHVYTELAVVTVCLRSGALEGRGEAAGVDYLGETPESMLRQIDAVRPALAGGASREQLQALLPVGGARNALDCALWDIEAARAGQPVWKQAHVPPPAPCLTTWTIGADAPEIVGQRARDFAGAKAIKLKLVGDGRDAERVGAARSARPDVWLSVDGNQGFSRASLERLMPILIDARVALIEQPLPVDDDADLAEMESPIALAADESVQGLQSLETLRPEYSTINIKLDKCGGLTEALAMVRAARARNLGVMVGNMLGTSLAMAPAFIVGQLCDVVDLDGPALLRRDRDRAAIYDGGMIWCPEDIWGGGSLRAPPA